MYEILKELREIKNLLRKIAENTEQMCIRGRCHGSKRGSNEKGFERILQRA